MIIDGPWIFPELNAADWKYNQQYGIVPIPVRQPGQTVITPLGGETMDIGAGGSSAQQRAAWEWIEGMQQPFLPRAARITFASFSKEFRANR
jgi:multiple sugar transport system substrate-binding protein